MHFQLSTPVNVLRGINDLSLQMPGDEPELFDDLLLGDWANYGNLMRRHGVAWYGFMICKMKSLG